MGHLQLTSGPTLRGDAVLDNSRKGVPTFGLTTNLRCFVHNANASFTRLAYHPVDGCS